MEAGGGWKEFFSAAAGASAALAGLIFVALSANIARILKDRHLPARAATAVGMLILILTVSLAALAPQPPRWLGGEVLTLTLLALGLHIWSAVEDAAAAKAEGWSVGAGLIGAAPRLAQLATIVAGGGLLLLGHVAGYYWLAGGATLIVIFAVADAWVLLVEVLR